MKLQKVGYVLAFIGAVVIFLWGLSFVLKSLPHQEEFYYYGFKAYPFVKGIYLLVSSSVVFWGATLMKEAKTLMKGSIIVSVTSFLSIGGVGFIGGIIGIIAAKRQKK
ncbi:MAG: hypothetical protein AABX37_01200 [Nanoarchaeota archaeon]